MMVEWRKEGTNTQTNKQMGEKIISINDMSTKYQTMIFWVWIRSIEHSIQYFNESWKKYSIRLTWILLLYCERSITDTSHHIPEDCDTASRQRQAQDWLGYTYGLEAELAAKTERTVTHEGHRYDWPVHNNHSDWYDIFTSDSPTLHMNNRLTQK
jgi:hypothetical protein